MALATLRTATSALLDRLRWASQVGMTFNGLRNLYQVLGYKRELTFFDFYDRYMRDGIARAVVEAYPTATWRGGVELYEDENPKVDTEFEKAFKLLDERLGFWQKCQQVDIAAGLSTFAVLLIGNGEADVSTEMKRGGEVLFLKPYFGGSGPAGNRMSRSGTFDASASIARYNTDTASERFGEPEAYYIRQSNAYAPGFNREVHHSRIIHVAEGTLEDDVFGIPTLQCVFNLFDDLAKLVGGGSEAFWLRANQGLQLDVDKDMGLPGQTSAGLTSTERADLKEKAEELQHQLQRVIVTRGVTATQLGSDVAQFSTSGDFLLKLIAGAARIPLRILTGSDRVGADLEQDAANFDSRVQDRRTGYAAPKIVRRAIDRFIKYDMLPAPKQYHVGWPVEETMDEDGKAKYALTLAQVNQTQGATVFTDEEIRDMAFNLEPLTDEQKQALADEAAKKVADAQAAMANPKVEPAPEDEPLAAELHALEAAIEADDLAAISAILGLEPKTLQAGPHSYASTQVQLDAPAAAALFALGRSIPDADLYLPEGGRETDAHVTVRYGVLNDDPQKLTAVLAMHGPVSMTFGETNVFGGEEYDVVYVEVESPSLAQLNRVIENLVECKLADHGDYTPHATVAYVKPGLGSKYVGRSDMAGMTMTTDTIVLSDVEGARSDLRIAGGLHLERRERPHVTVNMPEARAQESPTVIVNVPERPLVTLNKRMVYNERGQLTDIVTEQVRGPELRVVDVDTMRTE